jgi:excisionase family DNA binding protein
MTPRHRADDQPLPASEPVMVSVREVARVLSISRSYAYELVARKELPSARIGRRIVVPLSALRSIVASAEQRSA